jgi:hypothetical protein
MIVRTKVNVKSLKDGVAGATPKAISVETEEGVRLRGITRIDLVVDAEKTFAKATLQVSEPCFSVLAFVTEYEDAPRVADCECAITPYCFLEKGTVHCVKCGGRIGELK